MVKETHGSLGQCVPFSLIDVGSGFTASAYVVFLSIFSSPSQTRGSAATPCRPFLPQELPNLCCHLAALTLVLCLDYRVFHNQSQKIGTLNYWPSTSLGSVKYLV